jgi:hypothetical protein
VLLDRCQHPIELLSHYHPAPHWPVQYSFVQQHSITEEALLV